VTARHGEPGQGLDAHLARVLVRKHLAPPRRGGANYHWHPPGLRGPRFLRSSRWFFGNLFGGFLGRAPYCAARISRGVTFRVPRGRSFGRREYRPFRRAKQSLTLPWCPGHPFKGRKAIEYTPDPRHVAGRASARYSPDPTLVFILLRPEIHRRGIKLSPNRAAAASLKLSSAQPKKAQLFL